MYLSRAEESLLKGARGDVAAKAMKILVTLGDMLGAEKMIKVSTAQVSGISYLTIGDAGLDLLEDWSSSGVTARVRTTTNPAGMDRTRWREMNVPEYFATKQLKIMACFDRMRLDSTYTCVPYMSGNRPRRGQHISWAESSAVVFANSVIGARTNRESGISALASAITGVTPLHGLHLEEERRPTCDVRANLEIRDDLQYSALGYFIGQKIQRGIPNLVGLQKSTPDNLKALGASMGASGAIPMFTRTRRDPSRELIEVAGEDIRAVIEKLSTERETDHVCIGCPHLSLPELNHIAQILEGKAVKKSLWCFTSRQIWNRARDQGCIQRIEKAGGKVFCDTCMVVSPMKEMGCDNVSTNSCKAAYYLPSTAKTEPTLRTAQECIDYATA